MDCCRGDRFISLPAMKRILSGWYFLIASLVATGAEYPAPLEGDGLLRDFVFASGEKLPELRIHYRTVGELKRDERGVARNAVLIMHGTSGSGGNLIRPEFAGALFGAGQPLDGSKYFVVLV